MSDEELDAIHQNLSDEQLVALASMRGGCRCHLSPPCDRCTAPLTEIEAYAMGLIPDIEEVKAVRGE